MTIKSDTTIGVCVPRSGHRCTFATILLIAIGVMNAGSVESRATPEVPMEGERQVLEHFKGLDQAVLRQMVEILVKLGEGKPESAAKLFQDNSKKALNPIASFEADVRRDFSKLAGRLNSIQTVEYIGNTKLSKNLSLALFALNTDYNMHYFVFSLLRQGEADRFDGFAWKADWEDMLQLKVGFDEKPFVVWEFPRVER